MPSVATLSAFCEAWGAGQAREKPTARQNRSPWLPLEGIHTVGMTLNDFDGPWHEIHNDYVVKGEDGPDRKIAVWNGDDVYLRALR